METDVDLTFSSFFSSSSIFFSSLSIFFSLLAFVLVSSSTFSLACALSIMRMAQSGATAAVALDFFRPASALALSLRAPLRAVAPLLMIRVKLAWS